MGGYMFVDFANNYGFTNETDPLFNQLINYTEINQTIANFESNTQDSDQDPGLIQYLANLAQLVFGGVYSAFKALFGLTDTLTSVASNGLTMMGLPQELQGYVFGAITIVVIISILVTVGVIRRR
jgi:hypothetical protein